MSGSHFIRGLCVVLIPLIPLVMMSCLPSKRKILYDQRDGQTYRTVKIGEQWWMAENLRYLPYLSPPSSGEGIWMYELNDIYLPNPNDLNRYREWGCLYSWAVAMDIPLSFNTSYYHDTLPLRRGICPDGWHLPSDAEWSELESFLDTEPQYDQNDLRRNSGNAGEKLKSSHGWEVDRTGSNESGFDALPGGMRYHTGYFHHGHEIAYFWTSTEIYDGSAWYRCIVDTSPGTYRGYPEKNNGFSIRCIRDDKR